MQNHSVKFKSFKFLVVVFSFYLLAFNFSGTARAIERPALRGTVGLGTVPPSSVRGGLIRSPNPIDTSSNLPITGNVRAGRHFRGIVPYRATSDFGAAVGSSSLDSFIRDSASSEDFGRYTARFRPYYSPSGTVTTTRPGYSGVFRPSTTRIRARAGDRFALSSVPSRAALSGFRAVSAIRLRPMSKTLQEMERIISRQASKYPLGGKQAAEQRQWRAEQSRRELKPVERDDSLRMPAKGEPSVGIPQRFETQPPKQQTSEGERLDVYERMKRQLDNLQKAFEQLPAVREPKEAVGELKKGVQESSQAEQLSEVTLSVARAKAALGSYKSFARLSEDKFNQYILAGEEYLKQGRYYRAADAYTLASIYKPSDPLSFAGKSHALFAAGEYMSSALFLSRALAIFPEYARFKIDLVAMVGDRDKLESRIVDVESWLQRSGAAELQFLLGYVYYQMDRIQRAKEAIDAAYEKMPESPAVDAVRKAIDERIQGPNPQIISTD